MRKHLIAWATAIAWLLAGLSPAAGAAGYEKKLDRPSREIDPAVGDAAAHAVLDVNSATKEELKTLPGVSDDYAQRIIDNRPYRDKDDLILRRIVPGDLYDRIRGRVTINARRPGASGAGSP